MPVAAFGAVVRSVTACPGMLCRNGIIDAQGLAQRIDEAFRDFQDIFVQRYAHQKSFWRLKYERLNYLPWYIPSIAGVLLYLKG